MFSLFPVVCPVTTWTRPEGGRGGRIHYTHASAAASNDSGPALGLQFYLLSNFIYTTVQIMLTFYTNRRKRLSCSDLHSAVLTDQFCCCL